MLKKGECAQNMAEDKCIMLKDNNLAVGNANFRLGNQVEDLMEYAAYAQASS